MLCSTLDAQKLAEHCKLSQSHHWALPPAPQDARKGGCKGTCSSGTRAFHTPATRQGLLEKVPVPIATTLRPGQKSFVPGRTSSKEGSHAPWFNVRLNGGKLSTHCMPRLVVRCARQELPALHLLKQLANLCGGMPGRRSELSSS